jgi:hypothetical protein
MPVNEETLNAGNLYLSVILEEIFIVSPAVGTSYHFIVKKACSNVTDGSIKKSYRHKVISWLTSAHSNKQGLWKYWK